MAAINKRYLQEIVYRQVGSSKNYIDAAYDAANQRFEAIKQEFLSDFENHPVTQEIEAGPNASNITNSIQGVQNEGNLFSFLGLEAGDNPIKDLREALKENINLLRTVPDIRYEANKIVYRFRFELPNMEIDIHRVAPMPWGTAISWVYAVENGISGINRYLYEPDETLNSSRSGPALQVKKSKPLRSGGKYTKQKYLTEMIAKLKSEVGSMAI